MRCQLSQHAPPALSAADAVTVFPLRTQSYGASTTTIVGMVDGRVAAAPKKMPPSPSLAARASELLRPAKSFRSA